MPQELTESQQLWIYDNSESHTIKGMSDKFEVPYNTVYNFCKKHCLKYSLNENRKPQKRKTGPKDVSYAELLKERAAIVPDLPRKWERVKGEYSNFQREQYIDKILNDEK